MSVAVDFAGLDARVRELYAAGLDDAAIGAALGVSARTVKRARRRLDLLRRDPPAPPVPDDALLETYALLARGLRRDPSAAEIATVHGLTDHTVEERISRLRTVERPLPLGSSAAWRRRTAG